MSAPGVVRVIPLANFLSTANALSTAGFTPTSGAGYLYSTGSTGREVYAGLHLVSCSAVSWTFTIQSATATGFAAPTTRFTFTAQACAGAQWPTPLSALPAASTELFWRAAWTPTATTDTRLGLIWVSIQ